MAQWFVSIIEENNNTPQVCRDHAEKFIQFLNEIDWKHPQKFDFSGDEMKTVGDQIIGTWDMYLMNLDIAAILKQYIFEDLQHFLADNEAIVAVYGPKRSKHQARDYLKNAWLENM